MLGIAHQQPLCWLLCDIYVTSQNTNIALDQSYQNKQYLKKVSGGRPPIAFFVIGEFVLSLR